MPAIPRIPLILTLALLGAGIARDCRSADLPYAGTSLAPLLRGETGELPERTLFVQYGQTPKEHEACVIRGRPRAGRRFDVADAGTCPGG